MRCFGFLRPTAVWTAILTLTLTSGVAIAGAAAAARPATMNTPHEANVSAVSPTDLAAWRAYAGGIPRVARYKDDKQGAVSLTFDDGFRHQVDNATAIIEPLKIRGTFFLIPMFIEDPANADKVVTWERARRLLAAGHEIGTHGSIREKLHETADERLDVLINESWRQIKTNTGVAPVSYAAPGGSKVDKRVEAVVRKHHRFIRKSQLLPNTKILGYGNTDRRHWSDAKTRKTITAAAEDGQWVIGVIHAIVEGWSPFKSKDEFRDHCRWLVAQDNLWIAPMGEVGRYVAARDESTLTLLTLEPGTVRFRLDGPAAKKTAESAKDHEQTANLTVAIPAPGAGEPRVEGVAADAVRRRGAAILIDAPADGRIVEVAWKTKAK